MLTAALRDAGCSALDLGVAPDDLDAIRAAVEAGLQGCDALITSGGVSVGLYDHIKAVLDQVGDMRWFQVAIKPAKPFAYGVTDGGKLVFGLPGNPVSSLVSFELFARPALRTMMGDPRPQRPVVEARARHDMPRRPDGKVHFDRVRAEWVGDHFEVERSGRQVSNVLTALAAANGLARLPDGDGVAAGEVVDVVLLGW
jgi:molybdenum cofactor synthesis domain-containing protein